MANVRIIPHLFNLLLFGLWLILLSEINTVKASEELSAPAEELSAPPCESNPCQSNSICEAVSSPNIHYVCRCDPNYIGTHCEFANPCESNPCQFGSTCQESYSPKVQYNCYCLPNYIGTHCEQSQSNLARGKDVYMSSPGWGSTANLVDHDRTECAATGDTMAYPWIMVDLGAEKTISLVRIMARAEGNSPENVEVLVWDDVSATSSTSCRRSEEKLPTSTTIDFACLPKPITGRFVGLQYQYAEEVVLPLCEIEVYEDPCLSGPCTNGVCTGVGTVYYCSCPPWNFGPTCQYTFEDTPYRENGTKEFELILHAEASLAAGCSDIIAADVVYNVSQCLDLAHRFDANVFNYNRYYCNLQHCDDLTDLKLNDSVGGYDVYRSKRFDMVPLASFPNGLSSEPSKYSSLEEVTDEKDFKDFMNSWTEAAPDFEPVYVTSFKSSSGVTSNCTEIVSKSVHQLGSCRKKVFQEGSTLSNVIPNVITFKYRNCKGLYCSDGDLKLIPDSSELTTYALIDTEDFILKRKMDVYFPRMDVSEAHGAKADSNRRTMETVILPDLAFWYDSQVLLGWEFYAKYDGTFQACVFEPLGDDTYKLKHAETIEALSGQHKIALSRPSRLGVQKGWVIGLMYPTDAKNSVIAYYTASRIGGNYLTKLYKYSPGPATIDQQIEVTEKGTDDYVVPLRPIVTNPDYEECEYARPCQNSGTCAKTDDTGFSCACLSTTTGDRCETVVPPSPPCESNPCMYNGTCTNQGSIFECQCPSDRKGTTCQESNSPPCESNPCMYDGTCTDQGSIFSCQCSSDRKGTTCQETIVSPTSPCESNPCMYDGTCTNQESIFSCQCPSDRNGTTCQETIVSPTSPCESNPCMYDGTCTNQESIFSCQCSSDRRGTTCQETIVSPTSPCESNPCMYDGTCTNQESIFICQCSSDRRGTTCQETNSCVSLTLPEEYRTVAKPMLVSLSSRVLIEAVVQDTCVPPSSYSWSYARVSENTELEFSELPKEFQGIGAAATLKIKPGWLQPGTYAIRATVTQKDIIEIIYVTAKAADLVAIIDGGTLRTVTSSNPVQLDGTTKSYDPDDREGSLTFSWSCKSGRHSNLMETTSHFSLGDCPPLLRSLTTEKNGTVILHTTGYIGTVTVRLGVSVSTRSTFYDQVINVVDQFVPTLTIRCRRNCRTIVVPTSKFAIVVKCSDCAKLKLKYQWSLDIRNGSDYKSVSITDTLSTTGSRSKALALRSHTLEESRSYRPRVKVSCAGCADSVLEYSFYTDTPPFGGTCQVNPSTGEALKTKFVVECSGWQSGGSLDPSIGPSPLKYRFEARSVKKKQLLYFGSLPTTPKLPLKAGKASQDYKRTISIEVIDSYGAKATTTVEVQIRPMSVTETGGGQSEMLGDVVSTLDPADTTMTSQYIQSIGSMLNAKDGGVTVADATKLRKNMVNTIEKMSESFEDVEDAILVSESLMSTAELRDEIGTDTMATASRIMGKVLDNTIDMIKRDPESTERVAGAVLSANWNVLYATKPKTAPVDTPPVLQSAEEAAEALENSPMSPEERAFYEQQGKAQERARREEEKRQAKAATEQLVQVQAALVSALLENLVPGEDPLVVTSDKGSVAVTKQKASDLVSRPLSADITLPADFSLPVDGDTVVSQQVASFKENPFSWGDSADEMGSGVTNISFADDSGNELTPNSSISIEFASTTQPTEQKVNVTAMKDNVTGMVYHKINVTVTNSAFVVQLSRPDETVAYDVYVLPKQRPNSTTFTHHKLIPAGDPGVKEMTIIIPGSVTTVKGIYYLGLKSRETEASRKKRSASNSVADESYSIKMSTTQCRKWDPNQNDWVASGNIDPSKTSLAKTSCEVEPSPTASAFGASVIAPPNMIDFSTVWAKFNNLQDNAVVFSVVIAIICLYFLLLIWAAVEDRKDLRKWRVDPLADDSPQDPFQYLVSVETGLGRGAGTKSNIFFDMLGRYGDSGSRRLIGNGKARFCAGSVMNFSMRTPVHLGRLYHLKLWHDNSGKGGAASWYVHRVVVDDKYEGISSIFMCNTWLSTTKGDGRLCRTFPVTTQEEKTKFLFLYKQEAHNKLTDSHLLLSVFLRPLPSNFNRAQRLTCFVALLFLSMVTSAMFYKTEDNVERPMQLKLGPISFSTQELFVSVITVLICLPPSLFIVQIFRWSNKRRLANLISPDIDSDNPVLRKEEEQETSYMEPDRPFGEREPTSMFSRRYNRKIEPENANPESTKATEIKELPGFMLYIGWVVAILAILVPGFFVILYSMEWGAEKANQWLTAYLMSAFENIFVSDPTKVVIVAFFATIILYKASKEEKEYDGKNEVVKSEEDMTPEELAAARARAELETRARAALKELIVHTVFMVLVVCITYSATDSQAFYVHRTISDTITDSFVNKVNDFDDFFWWLTDRFIPNYFVVDDINGKQLHWRERKFMSDRASFRVGPARLRQHRVKPELCNIDWLVNQTCYGEYISTMEERAPFGPEVIRNDTKGTTYLTTKAWSYTPSEQVMGEPLWARLTTYPGGGYLAKMDINRGVSTQIINELKDNLWLDRQTRSVLLEFSVYNPNVQLFTFVTAALEVPDTGGVAKYVDIQIMRAYSLGFFTLFSYFCLFVVGVFSLVSLVDGIRDIVKQRSQYFKSAKNVITIIQALLVIAMETMFVIQMVTMTAVLKKMNEDLNEYVLFRRVALYDFTYKTLVAFVATLCILKFILLLKLNQRIGELIGFLSSSVMPLSSFFVVAAVLLMAFTSLLHYWYREDIYEMRSPLNTMAALVSIALGDFSSDQFVQSDPVCSWFIFCVYMFVMNIMLLNILTTILMESKASYHEAKQFHYDDYKLADLMIKKIFGGLKATVTAEANVQGIS